MRNVVYGRESALRPEKGELKIWWKSGVPGGRRRRGGTDVTSADTSGFLIDGRRW